ncbi:MAG: DUF4364 family protein, partial [Clostridiales bacterium]|nr:DUF4364 family protein [Clostridiales bacterium]
MGLRLKEKKDIKTFILYLLMQVDRPIDLPTLNDIVVQDEFVNQFDFMDSFYELCQTDAIISEMSDFGEVFSVSPKGRAAAEALESDIAGTIRERSACSAMRLLSFDRRGAKARSEIKEENGKFMLSCSVIDSDGKTMSLEVSLDTKKLAETMKRNFDEKPEFVYRAMLGVLSGDINYLAQSWIDCEDVEEENDDINS